MSFLHFGFLACVDLMSRGQIDEHSKERAWR
jgi:hypothetical protein